MSGHERPPRVILCINSLVLALPAVGGAAPPGSAGDLAHCAAIAAAAERLACYDALFCAGIATPDERLACYDALAKPKSPQPQAAPAVAARPERSVDDATTFGLVRRAPGSVQGPQQINAVVTGVSVDRQGSVLVALDNGQSWTFNDPDARLNAGDAVTIRRAALGSFLMTTPSRHTYRVQRTK
jgi:hypothetical protein